MRAQGLCIARLLASFAVALATAASNSAAEGPSNWSTTVASNSPHVAHSSWPDDNCYNTISYDPEKYGEERLRATVHLLFGPADFNEPHYPLPFEPKHIGRISLENVEQQCKTSLETANRLKFIPLDGIEDYWRAKIADVKDVCDFSFAEIRGFQDRRLCASTGRLWMNARITSTRWKAKRICMPLLSSRSAKAAPRVSRQRQTSASNGTYKMRRSPMAGPGCGCILWGSAGGIAR
jgi:hypothetical protein